MLNLTILPMLGLVGYFATQHVDWAALSDHATAKAMSMLGQTRPIEAAAATTAKPAILVIGKNSVTKPAAITDASPNGLGQTDWAKRRQKRRLAIVLAAVSLQVQPQYFSLREA